MKNELTLISNSAHQITAQIEGSILGALICKPDDWDMVCEKLKAEYFTIHQHATIFRAMKHIVLAKKQINILTLELELKENGVLEEAGGFSYLSSLALNSCGSANINHYVEEIGRQFVLRSLAEIGSEIVSITKKPEGKTASQLCSIFEEKIFKIQENSERANGSRALPDIVAQVLNEIETIDNKVIETGFIDLDRMMCGGMRPQELIIIAGRPGSGKTTLALNIAEHVGLVMDKGVLIYSMEMSDVAIVERLFASQGKIHMDKMRMRNKLTSFEAQDWDKIARAIPKLKSGSFRIDSCSGLTPAELRSRVRRDARKVKDLSLIVVDYIQKMESENKTENRANKVAEFSGCLKSIAQELQVPVIGLSQLNRGYLTRPGDKRPSMSDLRESGALEQDADMVALIHRSDHPDNPSSNTGITDVIIDKQRNGETGIVKLLFQGKFNCFVNYREYM